MATARAFLFNASLAALLGFVALAVVAPAHSAPSGNDEVVVTLRTNTTVAESRVCIGQVAEIQGGTMALQQKIAKLDLVELSAGSPEEVILKEQVRIRIQLAGVDAKAYRVEGPAKMRATLGKPKKKDGEIVPARYDAPKALELDVEITSAAKQYLLERLTCKPEEVFIEQCQPIRHKLPPLGAKEKATYEAEARLTANMLGKVRVEVVQTVNGEKRGTVPVWYEIKKAQWVAVTTKAVERGQPFGSDNLRFERRAFDDASTAIPAETALGKKAKRAVAVGHVIGAADLDSAPVDEPMLIKRRDPVELVASLGSLKLKTKGEALQDGRAGQIIEVRNLQSDRKVRGRVVDRGLVEVDY